MDRRGFLRLGAAAPAALVIARTLPEPRRWWYFGWQPENPLIEWDTVSFMPAVSRETFARIAGELLQQAILWRQQERSADWLREWERGEHGLTLPVTRGLVTTARTRLDFVP